MGNDVI